VWVTRILALNFPLTALGAIHETFLVKDLAFNKKFIPDFARAFSKGIISILLAISGFSYWSLVIGQLVGTIFSVVILWIMVAWRPIFSFSIRHANALLKFGMPLVGMNVVSVFVLNVDYLLVGRYLGADELGVYSMAFRIPEMTVLQLCNIVAVVIFPVFAKMKDDPDALGKGFLQTAQYVALITVPAALGLALLAGPFVMTFLGVKWIQVIPVMQAISIYALLISLGYNAGDVYKAQGRSDILAKIALLHAFLLVPALMYVINSTGSIVMVGWTQAGVAFIISVVYLFVAMRILKLSPALLLNTFKIPFIPAVGMCLAIIGTLSVLRGAESWVLLVSGTIIGAAVYGSILWLINRQIVDDAVRILRSLFQSRFVEAEG
jgi:PST family polysaccharide transporter